MNQKLTIILMLLILAGSVLITQTNATPYTWEDTFNYSSIQQMQLAGWILENPAGTSLSGEGLVIDGTGSDTVIRYLNKFPAGIFDWNVTTRSKWTGVGHSGPGVSVVTENHSYSIFADGWYSHYAFGRDGQNTIFGTYTDQVNVWITMSLVKTGNIISVYSNGELIYRTTESDAVQSALTGVDRIAPWKGIMVYNYYSLTAPSIAAEPTGVWAPEPTNAFAAATIVTAATVGMAAAATTVASIASVTGGSAVKGLDAWTKKVYDTLPDAVKSWLEEYVSSKNKKRIEARTGSPYKLLKGEVLAYVLSIASLTFAYSYSKGPTVVEMLASIPLILLTSVLFSVAKNYVSIVTSRRFDVWAEHRVWPLGLLLFMSSSLILRVPFSSPSRLERSENEDKRLSGLLSASSIALTIVSAGLFYLIYSLGGTIIGNIGVIMCLTSALFDSLPISPMGGGDIMKWDKRVWVVVFLSSALLFAASILYF